ncbi:MAG: BON domain-containing protein [Wenzhouxiangella sp.]
MIDIASRIQADLERNPAINLHNDVIRVVDGDEIRLEGAVSSIANKRRALHVARQSAGTLRVSDHLRLRPDEQQGDDLLCTRLDQALRGDSEFQGIPIDIDREPEPDPDGRRISLSANDGAVSLSGVVPSLSHRRLAEVMTWWIPGVTAVSNRLRVEPPEEENDGEIQEALDLVFAKDPALSKHQINVLVRDGEVTLGGTVGSEEQKARAEADCWYLPGVREVNNELEITGQD